MCLLGETGKKKNDCKASFLRRTFKGTNTTFLFFFSISINLSASVCRSNSCWNEGLVRTCTDTKCLSDNKHTDQSIPRSRVSLSVTTMVKEKRERENKNFRGRSNVVHLHSSTPDNGSFRNPWCMTTVSSFQSASELGEGSWKGVVKPLVWPHATEKTKRFSFFHVPVYCLSLLEIEFFPEVLLSFATVRPKIIRFRSSTYHTKSTSKEHREWGSLLHFTPFQKKEGVVDICTITRRPGINTRMCWYII